MTVSRRLRFEILRRDGFTCFYCGAKAPDATLTVDHVIAVALGGGDEPTNLVTACSDCNSGKSSVPVDAALVAQVDASAALFAKAMERAAEERRADVEAMQCVAEWFVTRWDRWGRSDPTTGDWVPASKEFSAARLPAEWATSIERFWGHGLDGADLDRLIEHTMKRQPDNYFRFFCKLCWNEIGSRQELARQLIEDGKV